MAQIGLWGSYDHGNFGDDLMAAFFARTMTRWGHEVAVLSNNSRLSDEKFGYSTARLAEWQGDSLVIGGGAMLSSESLLKFCVRPASRDVDREFRELNAYCERNEVPVLPISIGGDGGRSAAIWGQRKMFFGRDRAKRGTVRLESDVDLARRKFGKSYELFPDVLFSVGGEFISKERSTRTVPRVGVNLNAKRAQPVVQALRDRLGSRFELIPLITHSSHFPSPYEWGVEQENTVRYEKIEPFLSELASLDVVVSDKLHVGLVSATLGVPFLSYQGRGKTKAAHTELGLADAISDEPADLVRKVELLVEGAGPLTLRDAIERDGLAERSGGHAAFLRHELEQR